MTDTAIAPGASRWIAVEDRDNPWNILSQASSLMGAGSGETVTNLMTADEVLTATNLNITIRKYPVSIDTGDDHMLRLPQMFVTGHEHEGDVVTFGPVSDRYEVVQPAEALSAFDGIVAEHEGAHYTSAWNMPEKARMGITIRFPERVVIDPNGAADTLSLDMLGVNSFDGSTSLMGIPILTRLFCTNQVPALMRGAKLNGFKFKHSATVGVKAKDARRVLAATSAYVADVEASMNALAHAGMAEKQFARFLEQMTPFVLTGQESDLSKARVLERRDEAMAAWHAPHNENVTGTRYGALQVVIEYSDWGRRVVGSARTGADPVRQRALGTMVHPDPEKWKREAFETLAAMR